MSAKAEKSMHILNFTRSGVTEELVLEVKPGVRKTAEGKSAHKDRGNTGFQGLRSLEGGNGGF